MAARATLARLRDRPETASTPHPPKGATPNEVKVERAPQGHQHHVLPVPAQAVPEDSPDPVPALLAREVSVVPDPEASEGRVRPECVPH